LKDIAFVVYYHKDNIYSFNALIGALETEGNLHDIKVYYLRTQEEVVKDLKKIIENYKKVVLGVSFFTTQLWDISSLIRILREKFSNKLLIVAGGPHATGDPSGTLKLGVDVVVVGEGEETIIELMQTIKNNEIYPTIKGIAYFNDENKYIFTGKRDLINLDEYPPFPIKNTRFGAIEITRGCPYVCYFCQTPFILGTSPRHRSIEIICRYVQELKDYYGNHTDIRFITPNAFSYLSPDGKTLDLARIEELLSRIRKIVGKKGRIFFGSFPSEVRPEHVTGESLKLILKYADNDNIIIGAQSGSEKILEKCHRGHTVAEVYKAVELTVESGLKAYVDFIFGLPGESEEDIYFTIKMMKDLSIKGAKIHAHSFMPLPQTPFSKVSVKRTNEIYKNEITGLISKGLAFGNWEKQERLAVKISKYLRQKENS
jgi:B12-binding domain/radical SAM domain protein